MLSAPDELLLVKEPFKRGIEISSIRKGQRNVTAGIGQKVKVPLPRIKYKVVTQDEFLAELDPMSHKVLFDDNIPSITAKLKDGSYHEVVYDKMSVAFQRNILDKHVLHLCGNPMQFTLMNTEPTEEQLYNYTLLRQYWNLRNQDGMRNKMVRAQKSMGDAGLLYYFDNKGQIKSRLISFDQGYILFPHNDDNGDRILECMYYSKDDTECIDAYDDTYHYHLERSWNDDSVESGTWRQFPPEVHGFSEIPLITHRGHVAWDNVQNIIETYEVIYNVFVVIEKRHGWGMLYIKGRFKDNAQKIAGSIILNDTSLDGNGSAQYLTPPSPANMIELLDFMKETIQEGSGATFILPKDVRSAGDISAQAIMLTQSLDMETALNGVSEWQNVADKMVRLFKEGLAKELVNKGINSKAVTQFEDLFIGAKFKAWRPQNDTEYNNMLISLKASGLISEETGIEKNTESTPDEKMRRQKEKQEAEEAMMRQAEIQTKTTTTETGKETNTTTTKTE